MKVAVAVLRVSGPLGRQLGRGLGRLGRLVFMLALPLFGLLVSIKRTVLKLWAPLEQRSRILHLFTRRYVFHLTFVGLAMTVVTTNLNAYEVKRDELTYTNVFTGLAHQEDEFGTIEEIQPSTTPAAQRYQEVAVLGLGGQIPPGSEAAETLPSTIGSGALVKPIRLPSGLSVADLPAGVPRTDMVTYTVQDGDTISGIASRFGISINSILWENNLAAYSIIRPGQTLSILPVSGVRHKVVKGENLSKIAAKYGVETGAIISANKLASADDLKIGELILIPGGNKPRPAPTYALRRPAAAPAPAGTGGLVWPAGCRRITQYFGWRHTGVDIACSYGSAVYAADAGRVIKAQGGWNGGYGIIIVVQHANGNQTLYGHNSKIYVQVGEEITRGQTIAAIGSTGRSTGPHLHFEIRVGGYRKNPFSYLR